MGAPIRHPRAVSHTPLSSSSATTHVLALGKVSSKAFSPSAYPISADSSRHASGQQSSRILTQHSPIVADDTENSAVKVVVDDELDGQIVGVAVWGLARDEASGSTEVERSEPKPTAPAPPPQLDQNSFSEIKFILAGDTVQA
ncbi:unnamed protein product [Clonostachys rosea]|uniref:Uncharacterized protein n=1 Tax=Bionectria ochroleuca TaxID=29856 RepID=A0ABY6UYL2_BIOOC|nr:unnamed protein product [Clonostachys rosea]